MKVEFSNEIGDYINLGKYKERKYEKKRGLILKFCFYLFIFICILNILLSLKSTYTLESQIANGIITAIVIVLWILLFRKIPQISHSFRKAYWSRVIKNNPFLIEKKYLELTDETMVLSTVSGKSILEINIRDITKVLRVNDIILIYFCKEENRTIPISLVNCKDDIKYDLISYLEKFIVIEVENI